MTTRTSPSMTIAASVILTAILLTPIRAQDSGGLRIVVLDGEDSVNIIQQKTAVSPIVEVRDKNNLPIAGAIVTFLILGLESGGRSATFADGAPELRLTTDAAGRAAAAPIQPLNSGTFKIWIRARFQGQEASHTITQTNYATVEDAAKAGKTPGTKQSSQNANQPPDQTPNNAPIEPVATSPADASNEKDPIKNKPTTTGGHALSTTQLVLAIAGAAGSVGGVIVQHLEKGTDSAKCTAERGVFGSDVDAEVSQCLATPTFPLGQPGCNASIDRTYNSLVQYCSCLGSGASSQDKQYIEDQLDRQALTTGIFRAPSACVGGIPGF